MRGRIHPAYGLLILPVFLLIAYGNQFLYLSGNEFSDLTISHLPNALFLRRALVEWGQIPLWSPAILSGFPFVANPLSGLFYPPGWLAVIWPEAWMFNGLAGLHLVWGGVGMVGLLQQWGVGRIPAIFGALAFSLMPKWLAHYGAGHVTLAYAVAWTPWLLYVSIFTSHNSHRYGAAGILAVIFFADVRWAAFAGALWVGWWFLERDNFAQRRTSVEENIHEKNFQGEQPVRKATNLFNLSEFLVLFVIAAALVAPLAFPLMEFIQLSTRASLGVADVLAFSLPPVRLLGLLFPELGGMQEWVIYPGGMTFALALLSLAQPEVRHKTRFWWGVWLVAVLFSLGENLPGLRMLANLPGVSLLRVPSRAMFLAGMAMAVLAAFSLDGLLGTLKKVDQRRVMRFLVVLFAVAFAMMLGVWGLTGHLPLNFVWGAVMAGLALIGLGWISRASRPLPAWVGLALIGISVIDLWGVTARSLVLRSVEEIYSEKAQVAEFLADQPGQFRVYSPSYSLPQQVAARNGIELVDGVDPMQIATYTAFVARASGVPQDGYSVTVPPFAGEISTVNANYLPDAELLGLLNARFVVAEFDITAQGLTQVNQFENTRVYENTLARPRAWVEKQGEFQAVPMIWTPNRITIDVTGPGLLVVSEMAYPGWQVKVDGERADLMLVEGLLRGVELPSGSHQVVFSFHSVSFYLGLGLFGMAVLFLVINSLLKRKHS